MLDTSFCMSLLSQRPSGLRERFNAEADRLVLSSIALMELFSAAAEASDAADARRAVEDFASRFAVLDFDSRASQLAADLGQQMGRAGVAKMGYDLLVAAHARSQGLTLVTIDPDRFSEIRGLAVEKWS